MAKKTKEKCPACGGNIIKKYWKEHLQEEYDFWLNEKEEADDMVEQIKRNLTL